MLKPTVFSNWGLCCSLQHGSLSHFAHNDITNNNKNRNIQSLHTIWPYFQKHKHTLAKLSLSITNYQLRQHDRCSFLLIEGKRSKGQKVLPEHNEFSVFDWHFGWRRGDVFLVGGEHGCSVCGGRGFVPLPMWTQHNHTHSALSSVSFSSPTSSSSLQLYKTEKETCKETVKWLFSVTLLAGVSFRLVNHRKEL